VSVSRAQSVPNRFLRVRSRVTDKYAASPLRTAIFAVIRAKSLAARDNSSYYSVIRAKSLAARDNSSYYYYGKRIYLKESS
jgi:hypothetical protein